MRYRALGGRGRFEEFYAPLPAEIATPLEDPSDGDVRGPDGDREPGPRPGVLDPVVHRVAERAATPPWGARLDVRLPPTARAGDRVVAAVEATNTGELRWIPPALEWPRLFLSYHVRSADERVLVWDGARTPIARVVDPGEAAAFLAVIRAPEEPGEYVLEWDVVSEGECWFAECGSPATPVRLRVEPRRAADPIPERAALPSPYGTSR